MPRRYPPRRGTVATAEPLRQRGRFSRNRESRISLRSHNLRMSPSRRSRHAPAAQLPIAGQPPIASKSLAATPGTRLAAVLEPARSRSQSCIALCRRCDCSRPRS